MNKKIYITAPFTDNREENIQRTLEYIKFALSKEVTPLTPHIYEIFIDISKEENKKIIERVKISLLWFCDEMWVIGDTVTNEMKDDIKFCENFGIRTLYIKNFRRNDKNEQKN